MTLKQILYVRAVSKAGSIGKAAESLFISQSSLSESIRNLEREYGMVLFERTSKGISLTRQGEAFLKDTQLLTNIYQDSPATAAAPLSRHAIGGIYFFSI